MILGFADRPTERLFRLGECPARWRTFKAIALRKLDMLDAATHPNDLRSPPGNRLESLKGDRAGQYSIRVNQQWRICCRWEGDGPTDVAIVDYH
jgi:proteic killer suppression protein